MPPVDLPRGNAGPKPAPAPKPAPRTDLLPHGSGVISKPGPATPRPARAYTAPAPKQYVPDATPHGKGTLTKVTPGSTRPASAYSNRTTQLKNTPSTKTILGMAAITPAELLRESHMKPAMDIAGLLGNQIYHLPGDTLKGVMSLGVPTVQGIGSLVTGDTHGALKDFGQVGSTAAQGIAHDPFVQAVTHGDPSYLAKDPLGTIMDASMLYSAAGKAAGFATGAGTEARAAHELVPGVPGTSVLRQPSGNAFTRAAQRYADSRGGAARVLPPGLQPAAVGHQLRQMVAQWYGPEKSQIAGELHATEKTLRSAKPKDEVVANVVPHLAAFGASPETLYRSRDFLRQAADNGTLSAKTGPLHLSNLEAAVAKHEAGTFDWAAAQKAADAYGGQQVKLDSAKQVLGLLDNPEAERGVLKQYALQHIDGTRQLPKAVSHPEDVIARRTALAQKVQAEKEFKAAQIDHAKNMAGKTPLEKQLADLRTKYAAANARAGMDAMRGNFASDPALRRYINADVLDEQIHDLAPRAQAERASLRQTGKDRIAATRENLKDARASYAMAKNSPLRKFKGLVTEDPNALPIQAGTFKGQRLRPMTDAEIRNHMDTAGVSNSYVNMTNPERQMPVTWQDLRANRPPRSGATGKPYTGFAAKTGDWATGYNSMARSQLQDVLNVGAARMERNFIDRFGMKDPNGNYFTKEDAQQAAHDYQQQHGIPMEVVQDVSAKNVPGIGDHYGQEHYVLVPRHAWEELGRQVKLERPTGLARMGLRFNRAFRNTTLPLSSKLWVMHPVENLTRAGMLKASPMSYGLERAVTGDMRTSGLDAEASRLEDIATPGGLGGQQHRLNLEDVNRGVPKDQGAFREQAGRVAKAWDDTARTIIRGQRAIEVATQRAALGVHMQRTLRSWGVSVTQTNFAVSKYVHRLAEAYADPKVAEDAAHYLHNSMGQYNNFTAHTRWFITRVSPFLPWYLNAAKLVMIGLPRDHPLISVLLHDVRQATKQQWDAQHQGLPADMQTDVQTGQGRWTDFARFLPVGLTGSPLSEGLGLVAPQYAGAIHALAGQDPFGGEYKGPNTPFGKSAFKFGDWGTVPRAFEQLGESSLGPIPDLAKAIENRTGSTMYNTSMPLFGQAAFKPHTEDSHLRGLAAGLARIFNPFRSTQFGGGGAGFPTSLSGGGGLDLSHAGGQSLKGATGLSLKGAKSNKAPLTGSQLARIPSGRLGFNYGTLPATTPFERTQFAQQFTHDYQQMVKQGLLPRGAKKPALRFLNSDPVGGGRSFENHGKVYVTAEEVKAALNEYPALAAWGHEIPIHEIAHAYQSPGVLSSVPVREGGAQAFADAVAARLGLGPLNTQDTNYSNYVQQTRRRGAPWYMQGQFS